MNLKMLLAYLINLGELALYLVGISATLGFVIGSGFDFISQLPAALEGFTYAGSSVGILQGLSWMVRGKPLVEE